MRIFSGPDADLAAVTDRAVGGYDDADALAEGSTIACSPSRRSTLTSSALEVPMKSATNEVAGRS